MNPKHLTALAILAAALAPAAAGEQGCRKSAEECLARLAKTAENRGWVGIEITSNETTSGYTIVNVFDESPAQAAGLEVGDVLKEFNGIPYGDESRRADLKEGQKKMTPGATIVYTVSRNGERLSVPVELGTFPAHIIYQMAGRHMLEEHVERAAN